MQQSPAREVPTPSTGPPSDPELTAIVHAQMPFTEMLGVVAVSASAERVVTEGSWATSHCTSGDALHGGYLMALADATGAACAALNLPRRATTTTIESKTNFLRAVRAGRVTAIAVPLHVGATTIVVQTDVVRSDGRLVSRTTQTQAVIASTRAG